MDEVRSKTHDNDCTGPLHDPINKQHQNVKLVWAHFVKRSLAIKESDYLGVEVSLIGNLMVR